MVGWIKMGQGHSRLIPALIYLIIAGAPSFASQPHRSIQLPHRAFARNLKDLELKLSAQVYGGDYSLASGDTIREDVAVMAGTARIAGVIIGDLAVMGGEAFTDGMIDGNVVVFGGNLKITGTVTGDATVFGGNIRNSGIIEGDLLLIGGAATLDSGSILKGGIEIIGGSVDRDPNAVVMGQINALSMGKLEQYLPRLSKLFYWPRYRCAGVRILESVIRITLIIVFYLLTLLALLIFPKAIDATNLRLKNELWISLAIGVAVQVCLIPAAVLLVLSIIGILLIPLLFLAFFLACIFGFTSVSEIVGKRICESANWQIRNRLAIFSIGWLALMIIPIIAAIIQILPVTLLGFIIGYAVTTIGLGGVFYTLVKREERKGI